MGESILTALAVVFVVASTFYSLCWIYYVRHEPPVIFSDGVTAALDDHGEEFRRGSAAADVQEHPDASAERLLQAIAGAVISHASSPRSVRVPRPHAEGASRAPNRPRVASKIVHVIRITHRDEVEPPITDWLREAYELPDALSAKAERKRVPPKACGRARKRGGDPGAAGGRPPMHAQSPAGAGRAPRRDPLPAC